MTAAAVGVRATEWPALPYQDWSDTLATVHRWTQMVGKTRLALAPMLNHWWQVTLYVTSRGLTTSAMPYGGSRLVEVSFDFLDHELVIETNTGERRAMPLVPRSVADFYGEYRSLLVALKLDVHLWPVPVELADATPFAGDRQHTSYDADAMQRCWRAFALAHRALERFRGRFIGKASPVHFFWGAFDLAVTRFSGRAAPRHPGGIPNCPNYVMYEAYSHEVASVGFWPGSDYFQEAAFYAYAYPEPEGFPSARVRPSAAYYHPELREFILPLEAVRGEADPDAAILNFAQSVYDVQAELAGWDRGALERRPAEASPAAARIKEEG